MTLKLFELVGTDEARPFSPFCWRTRMALAHKGLSAQTIPWCFTEKEAPQVDSPLWAGAIRVRRRNAEKGRASSVPTSSNSLRVVPAFCANSIGPRKHRDCERQRRSDPFCLPGHMDRFASLAMTVNKVYAPTSPPPPSGRTAACALPRSGSPAGRIRIDLFRLGVGAHVAGRARWFRASASDAGSRRCSGSWFFTARSRDISPCPRSNNRRR